MKVYALLLALSVFPAVAQENTSESSSQAANSDAGETAPEQICFSPAQISRGVQQVEINKDETRATALLLSNPLRSETVDCSSNMFAYPFLREATSSTSDGVWFNHDTAEVALQLNWKQVALPDVKVNDIVVWRDEGKIAQVGSVNEIVVVDDKRWMLDVNIKPNSTPVLRYSFAIPQDLPLNTEVWRRVRK